MNSKTWKYTLRAVTVIAALGVSSISLASIQFGFEKITNNGNPDVGSQLTVDVYDSAEALADFSIVADILFVFKNSVGTASVVAEIYFDDAGGLLSSLGILDNLGSALSDVDFVAGANPPDLPGGNVLIPDFAATPALSSQADNPAPQNGIRSANDVLGLTFDLGAGDAYADVIAALNNGDLRIGMHVTGIGTPGGSDSYVSTGTVPEPTALIVWSLLIGLGAVVRRR